MKTIVMIAGLMFAVSTLGCIASSEPGDGENEGALGEAPLATGSYNGLSSASIRSAALNTQAAPRGELLGHALTGAGLTSAVKGLLTSDEASNELMHYIVACALSEDESVQFTHNGITRRYDGELGLASAWSTGTCGQGCREWVSACAIAHVNSSHVPQPINLVAGPFVREGGYSAYPYEEATYWGDIFESDANQERYACVNDATRLPRVCGADTTTCDGFLHGSGNAHVLEACPTTCASERTDRGQPNSTYYSVCRVDRATSTRTMTVWRSN